MENIVNVEGTELDVREYNGQMVVTFDDIDLVHKRPSGTARKAFNRNKKRFINGVDYIVLEKENSNVHRVDIRNIDIPNRGITVFTESGYLMLVKPFKDDLSWNVQRTLVNAYFAVKNQQQTTAIEEKPTLEFETDWFCINRGKINYICRCYDITSKEYMHHLLEVFLCDCEVFLCVCAVFNCSIFCSSSSKRFINTAVASSDRSNFAFSVSDGKLLGSASKTGL